MTDPRPDILARLEKLAALNIPDSCAEGVAMWLDILGTHVALLDEVPITDEIEPAPVFRA